MPRYNTTFDLDVNDMELIEDALRARKAQLSMERLALLATDGGAPDADKLSALDETINATHLLLGRLHNQKVFYRPRTVQKAPYISG